MHTVVKKLWLNLKAISTDLIIFARFLKKNNMIVR